MPNLKKAKDASLNTNSVVKQITFRNYLCKKYSPVDIIRK